MILTTTRLTYTQDLLAAWESGDHSLLTFSNASAHIKGIIKDKLRGQIGYLVLRRGVCRQRLRAGERFLRFVQVDDHTRVR
jgi:hypothetical protein